MTASNLYATKIYAEHPVGCWPIDDDLSYLSLMTDAQRDVRTWISSSDKSIYDFSDNSVDDPPFVDEATYLVSGITGNRDDYDYVEIVSQPLFNIYSETNFDQKVFAINTYVYHFMPAAFYEIGFRYHDGTEYVEIIESIDKAPAREWIRLGRTFDHNYELADASIFVRVFFSPGLSGEFLINGTSVGHWSETFSGRSLGQVASGIPDSTGLNHSFRQPLQGVPLHEYGPGTDTGYVFMQDHRLLAVNGGIPLVYGSNSVTTLVPSVDGSNKLPSLVVPGKGFLNGSGRYNNYTLEVWLRIDNSNVVPRKIFGPIATNDGVYVNGGSVALVIGDHFGTYSVGEWYRPMLMHVVLKESSASMMINGQEVINIPFDRKSANLPSNALYDEDWIGFYAWSDVRVYEIDTVSIFPYQVPSTVAKRRFVWGQGVESPEFVNASYLGTPHTIGFPYAQYHVNHSYPETARWDAAQSENVVVSRNSITMPEYRLPSIVTAKRKAQSVLDYSGKAWETSNDETFISFASSVHTDPCYLYYQDSNLIVGDETAFYVVASGTSEEPVPLFLFGNRRTGQTFGAEIQGNKITYLFNGQVYQTTFVLDGETYVAGIDFTKADREVAEFFGDPTAVDLKIGGDGTRTFLGRIYRVGFCSPQNAMDLAPAGENGVIYQLADKFGLASYTLMPIHAYGKYVLDVGVTGTWTETFPLDYFANNGVLDFLQFNISAPEELVETSVSFADISNQFISFDGERSYADHTGVLRMSRPKGNVGILGNGNVIVLESYRDLSMRMRLTFKIPGIYAHRFMLKDMSITSVANNTERFMELGTEHGHEMAPYTKVGFYYDTEINRPWAIYKDVSPYLYLTNDSGIHPLSSFSESESGLWVPINKARVSDYKISAVQLWLKYSENQMPEDPVELFSIRGKDEWIRFMAVDDGTGKRAKVYSIDGKTGHDYVGVNFHQDGTDVVLPYIINDHWTALGIDFAPLLDLDGHQGAISLISSCVFNNIVFYQTTSLQEQYTFRYRTWQEVLHNGTRELAWEDWRGMTWDQVAKSSTITHGVSVDEIYKTYVGTNRVVAESDDHMLVLNGGQVSAISSDIIEDYVQGQTIIATENDPKWIVESFKPA